MSDYRRIVLPLMLALGSFAAELPTEWIDGDTGHRVIRLSREDGTESLYFNQNAYTADGKKLIVTTAGGGIATINLATREVKPLVAGPVFVLVAGHKTGDVYYTKRAPGGQGGAGGGRNSNGATVYATNVDTGATREDQGSAPAVPESRSRSSEARTRAVGCIMNAGQEAKMEILVKTVTDPMATHCATISEGETVESRTSRSEVLLFSVVSSLECAPTMSGRIR